MADLATTQTLADGLSHQGLVYVCALSWTVSLVLFGWLMRISHLRIEDQREFRQEIKALGERLAIHMDRATEAVTLGLAEFQRRGRRTRSTEMPAVKPPGAP